MARGVDHEISLRAQRKNAPDTPNRLTRQSGYFHVKIRVASTARGQNKHFVHHCAALPPHRLRTRDMPVSCT